MNRTLSRLATCVLTVPAALLAAGGTASAETVPGCYGASFVIVCDATVTYTVPYGAGTTTTTVPVCAGTCTDYSVPYVVPTSTGQPLDVCVSYENRGGAVAWRLCAVDDVVVEVADEVWEDATGDDFCDWVRWETSVRLC